MIYSPTIASDLAESSGVTTTHFLLSPLGAQHKRFTQRYPHPVDVTSAGNKPVSLPAAFGKLI